MWLYMIRHGESVDDIEDCYGGIADFPLTEKGRQQAKDNALRLVGKGIQSIYSSPLARAHETSNIIAETFGNGIPIYVVEDLKERNSYGVLSGINKNRAKQIFGRIIKELKEKPGYSREYIEGAEDFDLFILRVARTFTWVIQDAQEARCDKIAIVTHGRFSQTLFEHVINLEGPINLNLAAINVIDYEPSSSRLVDI